MQRWTGPVPVLARGRGGLRAASRAAGWEDGSSCSFAIEAPQGPDPRGSRASRCSSEVRASVPSVGVPAPAARGDDRGGPLVADWAFETMASSAAPWACIVGNLLVAGWRNGSGVSTRRCSRSEPQRGDLLDSWTRRCSPPTTASRRPDGSTSGTAGDRSCCGPCTRATRRAISRPCTIRRRTVGCTRSGSPGTGAFSGASAEPAARTGHALEWAIADRGDRRVSRRHQPVRRSLDTTRRRSAIAPTRPPAARASCARRCVWRSSRRSARGDGGYGLDG